MALFPHPSHTLSSLSLLISLIFSKIPKHFIKGLFLDLKYPPAKDLGVEACSQNNVTEKLEDL